MIKKLVFLFGFFASINIGYTQILEPKFLLDSLKQKLNKINDYSADVKIKLNVSFIKIPVREAKVYYKKPDKIKLKSTGFALLPKKGINFSLASILNKPYTSVWVKREKVNGIICDVLKIIPLEDNPEILLATIWINRNRQLMYKVEANSKANGSFVIDFDYQNNNVLDLPSKLNFTFEINKMSLPMGITGDFDSDKSKDSKNTTKKATLSLIYSNYLVNKGIPNSFFEEDSK